MSKNLDHLTCIESDRAQIQRLFQNLIGNALKYHQPGIPLTVKMISRINPEKDRQRPSVTLLIEDNGIGFEEQYTERIFQPFQRLHRKSEYEGTGMGLAICQKIVDRHHGKITAQSTPGRGSVFIVTLPTGPVDTFIKR